MQSNRSFLREIGTAFAVLAVYLLTVLTPIHQARASQVAFETLGYSTIGGSWVLCTPLGSGQDSDSSLAKCPATGVGKTKLAPPLAHAVVAIALDTLAVSAPAPAAPRHALFSLLPPGGPRAPPALV